jgi:catechol 2,3-dioxygenase-like lactoylglutathione lyase family enzyme
LLSGFTAYATLPASDLQRARGWYEEKLGLSPAEESPEELRYESGGARFVVFKSSGAASGHHTQLGWQVQDLDSLVTELGERGVRFEEYDLPGFKTENGIATLGEERGAWFKDSEGNLLAVGEGIGGGA